MTRHPLASIDTTYEPPGDAECRDIRIWCRILNPGCEAQTYGDPSGCWPAEPAEIEVDSIELLVEYRAPSRRHGTGNLPFMQLIPLADAVFYGSLTPDEHDAIVAWAEHYARDNIAEIVADAGERDYWDAVDRGRSEARDGR